MLQTNRRDPAIMDLTAACLCCCEQSLDDVEMFDRLSQKPQLARTLPNADLVEGFGEAVVCGKNFWVGGHADEFMQAWPRHGPCAFTFYEQPHVLERKRVKGRLFAISINKYIGVYGNQPRSP